MEWSDDGIILRVTRHGESDVVLDALTPSNGRWCGYVKGGAGRRKRGELQVGNSVYLVWRSRIEENLGRFTTELTHSPLGIVMQEPFRLAAMTAACATLGSCLSEREPHPEIYHAFKALMTLLEDEGCTAEGAAMALVKLELGLLSELGFGLDLSECAATGVRTNLTYVSPKSARAICAEAGKPYHDKMLILPAFLLDSEAACTVQDITAGLALTGYFLHRNIWHVQGQGIPPARGRFIGYLG